MQGGGGGGPQGLSQYFSSVLRDSFDAVNNVGSHSKGTDPEVHSSAEDASLGVLHETNRQEARALLPE